MQDYINLQRQINEMIHKYGSYENAVREICKQRGIDVETFLKNLNNNHF